MAAQSAATPGDQSIIIRRRTLGHIPVIGGHRRRNRCRRLGGGGVRGGLRQKKSEGQGRKHVYNFRGHLAAITYFEDRPRK
jgi:hypothetical protein